MTNLQPPAVVPSASPSSAPVRPAPAPSAGALADPGAPLPAAVLFDMDGLLVDSEHLWFSAEQEVVTRHGGTWTHHDQKALLGTSLQNASRYIAAHVPSDVTWEEVAEQLVTGMVRRLGEGVEPQPGALDLLAALRDAGVPRALVSSSQRALVDAVLRTVGTAWFAVSVAGDEVTHNKPHPEPYLRAAAALGVEPARCVVLEDSPTGAAAGVAAGCAVVVVPSAPELPLPDRVHVVPALTELGPAGLRALVDAHVPVAPVSPVASPVARG